MLYFDTHAHYDWKEFDKDREELFDKFNEKLCGLVNIGINIEVLVPLTQWFIKDDNLRPFKIMGEVQKSLNGKTINGLGKMTGGDFALNYISDEVIDYIQYFTITSYD